VTGPEPDLRAQLSVILPCRNGASTLPDQLDALAAQSWEGSWELVIADNGSTDDSLAVVERYRDRLPALRVVDASARPGVSHALNAGIAVAAAQSVALVNDDDVVAEGWLEAMAQALAEAELVAGRLDFDRLNEPWTVAVRGRPQSEGLAEWGFADYLPFACGPTIGVRRALHDSIGGFDEEMRPAAEDMDYCWRLQLAGATFRFVPEAVTHYRLRHSLGGIFRQGLSYGEGHVLAYKKHRGLGLPPKRGVWRRGLRAWAGIVKRLLLAWSRARFALFVWHVGLRIGLARGSLKHRVAFL
jgi:GT2 family glycosyltransferase